MKSSTRVDNDDNGKKDSADMKDDKKASIDSVVVEPYDFDYSDEEDEDEDEEENCVQDKQAVNSVNDDDENDDEPPPDEEAFQDDIPHHEQGDHEIPKNNHLKTQLDSFDTLSTTCLCRPWRIAGVVVVFVVIVAVSILLALADIDSQRNNTPTWTPTPAPSIIIENATREEYLTSVVLTWSDVAVVLQTPDSPQAQALEWLIHGDALQLTRESSILTIQQRYILAVLFFGTQGTTWQHPDHDNNNDRRHLRKVLNWMSPMDVCEWNDDATLTGIVCDPFDGTIVSIILDDYGLKGSLPLELGHLSNLLVLKFNKNQLTGTLPTEFGYLQHLQILQLHQNQLMGTIPMEYYKNMLSLLEFGANSNQLTGGLPTHLGMWWSRLRVLQLNHNLELGGTLPHDVLWGMTDLKRLELQNVQLTGSIPGSSDGGDGGTWTILQRLEVLNLSDNQLTGSLPTEFGSSFVELHTLQLSKNSMTGILPFELGDMVLLETLRLEENQFQGTIPPEIQRLAPKLKDLSLAHNELTGSIPSEMGKLTELEFLNLAHNEFVGTVPRSLGTILTSLEHLHLNGNSLTGNLDVDFCVIVGGVSVLAVLDELEADCLGPSPKVACSCCTLCCRDKVEAGESQECADPSNLSPTLAPIVGPTPTAAPVDSGNNDPTPTLAPMAQQQPHNGQPHADVTERFVQLTDLLEPISGEDAFYSENAPQYKTVLWMAVTDLLPLDFTTARFDLILQRYIIVLIYYATNGANWHDQKSFLSRFETCDWEGITCHGENAIIGIDLSSNNLDGSIPTEINFLLRLRELHLQDNKLRGAPFLQANGNMTHLALLDMSQNMLSGNLPTAIGEYSSLTKLQLQLNSIPGTIPTELGNLVSLKEVDMSLNQLTGPIPTEVGQLSSLVFISLGRNQLNGRIPAQIIHCQELKTLVLDSNQLTGEIPVLLSVMSALEELLISENANLGGTIPTELGDISSLQVFEASHTGLTGPIPSEIGKITTLETFDVAACGAMTGTVPSELGNLVQLQNLMLADNQFNHQLPTEIGRMVKLLTLDASNNNLAGSIPSQLGLLVDLKLLNFSGNLIMDGPIPSQLGLLANLEYLNLSNMGLSGAFPSQLGNLQNLQTLYIQQTQVTGDLNGLYCTPDGFFASMHTQAIGANCSPQNGPSNAAAVPCICCTTCCDANGDNCVEPSG